MKRLSAKEWIAVGIAVFVVAMFLMGDMIGGLFSPGQSAMDQNQDGQARRDNDQEIQTAATSTGEATGEAARQGSLVTVHYTGRLQNGQVFDSSRNRGPFTFTLGVGQVIKGWDDGLMGARKGDKRTLTIAPAQGYGAAQGHPLQNETLIFDVEVLEVQNR